MLFCQRCLKTSISTNWTSWSLTQFELWTVMNAVMYAMISMRNYYCIYFRLYFSERNQCCLGFNAEILIQPIKSSRLVSSVFLCSKLSKAVHLIFSFTSDNNIVQAAILCRQRQYPWALSPSIRDPSFRKVHWPLPSQSPFPPLIPPVRIHWLDYFEPMAPRNLLRASIGSTRCVASGALRI